MNTNPVVALEARLRGCRNVRTLGVRPNFADYSVEERALIQDAAKIYYPSSFYAGLFNAMGKTTFPSHACYLCAQDKIRQTALFNLCNLSHPHTRMFYGRRQQQRIKDHFQYPFVGKIPRGSALGRGVFLIRSDQELQAYCRLTPVAYVQQYLSVDRDLRVVIIGEQVAVAYWRIAPPGEFRSNVARGARISFDNVPPAGVALAQRAARACGWNDVGLDVCCVNGVYYLLEANMKYGKAGFRMAGIDYERHMERLIEEGVI